MESCADRRGTCSTETQTCFLHVFDKHTRSSVSAQFTCLSHLHDCFMYNTASIYAACILIKNNKWQNVSRHDNKYESINIILSVSVCLRSTCTCATITLLTSSGTSFESSSSCRSTPSTRGSVCCSSLTRSITFTSTPSATATKVRHAHLRCLQLET